MSLHMRLAETYHARAFGFKHRFLFTQYHVNMMADLELFPKKTDEDGKTVEEKPKKRHYKKLSR